MYTTDATAGVNSELFMKSPTDECVAIKIAWTGVFEGQESCTKGGLNPDTNLCMIASQTKYIWGCFSGILNRNPWRWDHKQVKDAQHKELKY